MGCLVRLRVLIFGLVGFLVVLFFVLVFGLVGFLVRLLVLIFGLVGFLVVLFFVLFFGLVGFLVVLFFVFVFGLVGFLVVLFFVFVFGLVGFLVLLFFVFVFGLVGFLVLLFFVLVFGLGGFLVLLILALVLRFLSLTILCRLLGSRLWCLAVRGTFSKVLAPLGKVLAQSVDARSNERRRSCLAYADELAPNLSCQTTDNGAAGNAVLDHLGGGVAELRARHSRTNQHRHSQFLKSPQYIAGRDGP